MTTLTKTPSSPSFFTQLTSRTAELPYKLPTKNNLLSVICKTPELQAEAVKHAQTTRPYCHKKILPLLLSFLEIKQKYGSTIEQQLYQNNCSTPNQLLHRLLTKRPLMFMNSFDQFLLKNGHDGAGSEIFDRIGSVNETKNENVHLNLEHLMSYDEMPLASLLAVSTPSHFINSGSRNNMGRRGQPDTFVKKGVIVGQVGARFERKQRMEWCHCIVDETQNTIGRGYGNDSEGHSNKSLSNQCQHDRALLLAWANFYEIPYFPTFSEVCEEVNIFKEQSETKTNNGMNDSNDSNDNTKENEGNESHMNNKCNEQPQRFIELSTLGPRAFLDTLVFSKRMEYIAEIYLTDANERGKEENTQSVCHIVGLGLGVWLINSCQRQLYVDAFGTVLRRTHFPYIKDIFFAYIDVDSCAGVGQGEQIMGPANQIGPNIHFGRRDPADLDELTTTQTNTGKLPLLHIQYAWDGNSYPGNEYWIGSLSASGDPAAACFSTIPELQNPDVNIESVNGDNFYVVQSANGSSNAVLFDPISLKD
jgi:hypothetical protein